MSQPSLVHSVAWCISETKSASLLISLLLEEISSILLEISISIYLNKFNCIVIIIIEYIINEFLK